MADDKTLETVTLSDLAPASLLRDSQMSAAAQAVQPQLNSVVDVRTTPALLLHFDDLSSTALDHMAKQWDITTWRDTWPIERKRSILKTMFSIKSHIGTLKAVKEALTAFGASYEIVEWWQQIPTGTPHTFKVRVVTANFEGIATDDLQEEVMGLIDEAKPCRSHYEFDLIVSQQGAVKATAITRSAVFRRLKNL